MSVYKMLGDELPSVNERLFKDKYLPILLNMKSLEDQKQWLSIAVNPLLRVNVVDDAKNVLFWVPPINYSADTSVGGNLSVITDEYRRLVDIHGPAGEKFLAGSLGGAFVGAEPPAEDLAQWDMILARYGYISSTASTGSVKEEFVEDDEDEFA